MYRFPLGLVFLQRLQDNNPKKEESSIFLVCLLLVDIFFYLKDYTVE